MSSSLVQAFLIHRKQTDRQKENNYFRKSLLIFLSNVKLWVSLGPPRIKIRKFRKGMTRILKCIFSTNIAADTFAHASNMYWGLFPLQCYTSIYCFWWIKTFLLSSFESEPTRRNKTAMFIWSQRCLCSERAVVCSLYARRFLSQNYEPPNYCWLTVNMNCCVQCKFLVKTRYIVLADKCFYILWNIAFKIIV